MAIQQTIWIVPTLLQVQSFRAGRYQPSPWVERFRELNSIIFSPQDSVARLTYLIILRKTNVWLRRTTITKFLIPFMLCRPSWPKGIKGNNSMRKQDCYKMFAQFQFHSWSREPWAKPKQTSWEQISRDSRVSRRVAEFRSKFLSQLSLFHRIQKSTAIIPKKPKGQEILFKQVGPAENQEFLHIP